MTVQENLDIANQFLAKLGGGSAPEDIASMFSVDLDWNIPGSDGALPWIGRKSGRQAVVDFVRESGEMIERLGLQIHDVVASEERAIILGELATRIKRTGKTIETPYAIVLTISRGEITRFLMLEDSFATAVAATGD